MPANLGDTPLNTSIALASDIPAGGGSDVPEPWEGKIAVAWGDGNPSLLDVLMGFQNTVISVANPTPTAITTTVGRLVMFRLKSELTVNRIRYFGINAVAGIYTAAIYNASTGARVWTQTITVAAGWNSIATGLPITLAANTPYWMGIGANAASAVVGFRSPASPITNSLGLVALPGNLNLFAASRFAQVTLVAGAWPDPLPALAAAAFASGGTTGTVPLFYLDNDAAA